MEFNEFKDYAIEHIMEYLPKNYQSVKPRLGHVKKTGEEHTLMPAKEYLIQKEEERIHGTSKRSLDELISAAKGRVSEQKTTPYRATSHKKDISIN